MSSWDTQSQSLGSFQIGKEKRYIALDKPIAAQHYELMNHFGLDHHQFSSVRRIIVITIEIAIGKLITNKQTMKWMGIRWNEPMKYGHYVINKFDIKRIQIQSIVIIRGKRKKNPFEQIQCSLVQR